MDISEAYGKWAVQYDKDMNKTRDLDKVVTKESLGKLNFELVLELGCGTGKNTEWLQTKASKILGIDFSKDMLFLARRKFNNENIKFKKKDITKNWDWASDDNDLITCSLVLEHIEDLDFIFKQAFSKLRPGGHFFISELHPYKQYLGKQARFHDGKEIIKLTRFIHHTSEFLNLARESGFDLIELKEWFDLDNDQVPRILSLLFKKP